MGGARSVVGVASTDDRPGVLDEIVDEDGPGALLVVVREVLVDHLGEVKQEVPGVARDRPLVVLLRKNAAFRYVPTEHRWLNDAGKTSRASRSNQAPKNHPL